MEVTRITGIEKKYGKKQVLKGVSLDIPVGSCVGILGGNGCGKSTLLSILAGVLRADAGSFQYAECDLLKEPKMRSRIVGYVPQGMPLFDELTAKENLLLWYTATDIKRELNGGVLDMLGINDFIHTKVKKMSGGMKKRLSIGCAVHHSPQILLLDEPSAALDLVCKERVLNYLSDYKKSGGTVLLATHDITEIEFCDRLYLFRNGVLERYVYDGNRHKLVGML